MPIRKSSKVNHTSFFVHFTPSFFLGLLGGIVLVVLSGVFYFKFISPDRFPPENRVDWDCYNKCPVDYEVCFDNCLQEYDQAVRYSCVQRCEYEQERCIRGCVE